MTESGGPTTQAGIDYQNGIAALYLGGLLDLDGEERARVVSVRIEAPAHVDDIVVGYADGHRRWIQVKLVVRARSAEWDKLWRDLNAQRHDPDFRSDDRLCLTIGQRTDLADHLRECAKRTASSDETEWRIRLTKSHLGILERLEALLGRSPFPIFQRLDIDIIPDDQIADPWALQRMPASNVPQASLFAILRGIVGAGASRRELYQAPALRSRLRVEHGVRVEAPRHWGLSAYLDAISKIRIAVPGTSVGGAPSTAFFWPRAARTDGAHTDFDDEQLQGRHRPVAAGEVDLRIFPTPQLLQCIVHAGPGFGKSALLIAISVRAGSGGTYVPAIVPLAALAEGKKEVLEYLTDVFNAENSISIDWMRLCETGSALVLLDGLDEVPLSQRGAVVQKVERFARRFSSMPWLLTVRDTAVLPAGFDAQKLELLPLDSAEMTYFVQAVRPSMGEASANRLIEHANAYPDLERLLRIPLFLALLVATWKPGEAIPARRSDLIEAYLKTLFRPEEHKAVVRASDPETLREAIQGLAYQLLETGEIGAPERTVRKLLAEYAGSNVSTESLFDDALRCGMLRRSSSTRLVFPFPIVQEYLAGQALLEKHQHEIPDRIARAVERPWAQAVQFALERLPDGSKIAQAMLDAPDDAFATGVRLLARCILNGMACSAAVRESVGVRLAAVWHRQSYWTAKRIGQLLNDGWSTPAGPAVREALHQHSLLHDGAGEILAKLNDDALSLSVLRRYLENPQYVAHLGEFQTAVNRISAEAFRLYLDVVLSGNWPDDDVWAAASLIARLDATRISKSDLEKAFVDEALPTGVRLAAFGLAGAPPTDLFWRLVVEALSQPRASDHWAAIKAFRLLPNTEMHLAALLRDHKLSVGAHLSIIDHLDDALPDRGRELTFINEQAECQDLSEDLRTRMLIRAASFGDRPAFDRLLDRFDVLPVRDIGHVLRALSHFPDRPIGERVIAALRSRDFSAEAKADLVAHLLTGATNKFEKPYYFGGAVVPVAPHPSFSDFLSLISEWRDSTQFDLINGLHIEIIAARIRLPGAGDSLRRMTTKIIHSHDTRGYENPLNSGIRSAMDELEGLRLCLELNTAVHLAENTDSNAEIGALWHIGAIGGRPALDYLLERSRRNSDNYSTIFSGVEKIAGRLGLKIVETDAGLDFGPPAR